MGRSRERAAINGLLDAARSGAGTALCLVGEPGVGKSSLLSWAGEAAAGFTVVRSTGAEVDVDLPFGSLLDVVAPLRPLLAQLPPRQRDALEGALGWGEVHDSGKHLVAGGTLSLLADAARHAPLLVVLDDLPWVDRESAQVLAFAARRLRLDAVAFLLASRPESSVHEGFGATELSVRGLAPDDAARLLPDVSPPVLRHLVLGTDGNPLALLEARASLTAALRRGSAALPDVPSLGTRLQEVLGDTFAALSEPARRAVSLAAATRTAATGLVVDALRAGGFDAEAALDEATAGGLVVVGETVAFAHPLHRAAVWGAMDPRERRVAHGTWAAVAGLDPRIRLGHRIESTLGFDEDLSQEAERASRTGASRHGYADAVGLLQSAARLTSSRTRSARLLARAAEAAWLAGDTERASDIGARVRDAPDQEARSRALLTLGLVEECTGSVPEAGSLLAEAAGVGTGIVRVRALAELALVGYRRGDVETMAAAAAQIVADADADDPEQQMLASYMRGAAAAYGGRWGEARAPMAAALEVLESDPALRDDPRHLALALTAGAWMGEPERALAFADRRMQAAREVGAIGVLPFALTLVAGGLMVLGQHWRGYAYADEALRLGRELGYAVDVSTALELSAWQLAARGHHHEAVAFLEEARRLSQRAGVAEAAVQVDLVAAHAALCRGEPETTVALLERRISQDGGRMPNGQYELAVAPDLVEAYLALGRPEDAGDLARRHAALHETSESALARAHALRLRGMTVPDADEADASFRAAHDEHQRWPDPWEGARTRFQHGARLRRAGDRREARRQLLMAGQVFEELGFATWQARVESELAASGVRARRGPRRDEALTAQETHVAMLVASGLTNREIATSLFLSPRTIEHHVTAALRKTGARSRTELAVVMLSRPAQHATGTAEVRPADDDAQGRSG